METPQNNPHHCYNVGEHILHSMLAVEPDKVLRLGMLFHDIGKPQTLTIDEEGITHNKMHPAVGAEMTRKILRRLKFDNDTTDKVYKIVLYHDQEVALTDAGVRRAVNRMGEEIFPMILEVHRADIRAQSEYKKEEKLEKLACIEQIYKGICSRKEAVTLKDLAITGSDLIALGMQPGRQIGELLHELLELVLENPALNDLEELQAIAKKKIVK